MAQWESAVGGFLSGFTPSYQAGQQRQDRLALQRQQQERQAAQDAALQQVRDFQMQQAQQRDLERQRARQAGALAMGGGLMGDTGRTPQERMQKYGTDFDPLQYATPQQVYAQTPAQQQAQALQTFALQKQIEQQYKEPKRLSGDLGNVQALFPDLAPTELYQKAKELKQAGAINITLPSQEKAFGKKLGEDSAAQLKTIRENAQVASDAMANLDAAEAFLSAGLDTGALAPAKAKVSAIAESLGINPENLGLDRADTAQGFQTVVMKNLLQELAAQKGPQTEGDAQRAMQTFASLGNTREANMFAINYARALANRKSEQAKFIDTYMKKHGESSQAFNDARYKWLERISKIPLFRANPKTGMPVTYYQFMENAKRKGGDPQRAAIAWISQ